MALRLFLMFRDQAVEVSIQVFFPVLSQMVFVLRVALNGVPSVLVAAIPVVILGKLYYAEKVCIR